jgi:hypothetical protein
MTVKAGRRGHYLHNTLQTQEMNIHGLSGIRIRGTSGRTAGDVRLKPHGHRDRHTAAYLLQLL